MPSIAERLRQRNQQDFDTARRNLGMLGLANPFGPATALMGMVPQETPIPSERGMNRQRVLTEASAMPGNAVQANQRGFEDMRQRVGATNALMGLAGGPAGGFNFLMETMRQARENEPRQQVPMQPPDAGINRRSILAGSNVPPPSAPLPTEQPFAVNVYNGDQQSRTVYTPMGANPFGVPQYSGVSDAPAPTTPPMSRDQFINQQMARAPMGIMTIGGLPFQTQNQQALRDATIAWNTMQGQENQAAQLAQQGQLSREQMQNALEVARIQAGAQRQIAPQQLAGMRVELEQQFREANPNATPAQVQGWVNQRVNELTNPVAPSSAPINVPQGVVSQMAQTPANVPLGDLLFRFRDNITQQNWPEIEAFLRQRFGNQAFEQAAQGSTWERLSGRTPMFHMPWQAPSEQAQGVSMLRNLMRQRGVPIRGVNPGSSPGLAGLLFGGLASQ